MEIIGFIATMVSLMLSLLEQKTFGRLFGFSSYTTSQDTVFLGRSFMIVGRLCNYSLVRLYWMLVLHIMMIVTFVLEFMVLFPTFKIDTIPYYERTFKDLIIDSFLGKPTTFVSLRANCIYGDLMAVNVLVLFFLMPFVFCVGKAFFIVTTLEKR